MKVFSLKRILPGTLYGQIFLALFAGIFTLYSIMSFYIISSGRTYSETYIIGDRSRAIFSFYHLLNISEPSLREEIAAGLESSGYTITFVDELPELCCSFNSESEEMGSYIKNLAISENYPKDFPVHVSITDFTLQDYFQFMADVLFGDDTDKQHIVRNDDFSVKVALSIDSKSWVIFEGHGYDLLVPHAGSLTVPLIIFLVVSLFSFVIVYYAVQPLKKLAHATEAFSKNITQYTPLEDQGPTEVRDTIVAFNQMQKRIFDFINERSRLLAAISHDLRTPLTRIALRAEQLEEPLQKDFMKDITQLRQLMDTSIELGRATANTEKFVFVDVISLLDSIADDFASHGHHVEFSRDTIKSVHRYNRVPPIAVRLLCLKRALLNVIGNATSYGTFTKISVNDTQEEMTIEIIDNGPGIPEDKLEKVFEPFFRVEPSRNRATGGTGLGLAIARSMLQLCDGEIYLKNNAPQKGTTAVIKLARHN